MARITIWGGFKANSVDHLNMSGELQLLLNQSRLNVVNFEAPIKSKAEPIRKSGPNICQHPDSPEWLEIRGFNVVSLANNHTMDYCPEGLEQTRKAFGKAAVIGAGTWDEAYAPAVITTKDGLRVGG